jgi:hypothetical protein
LQDKKRERRDRERVSATRSNCAKKLQKTWACSGSRERERERERERFGIEGQRRIRARAGDAFDGCD